MHELAVTQSVLKVALDAGERANAKRILQIHIRLGEYSDVVPVVLREYFALAAKGTICEGAELVLERVPVQMRCRSCGWIGVVTRDNISCACCGSSDLALESGREFVVDSLEAE